jgi:uncharacterized protein (DUF433 family)
MALLETRYEHIVLGEDGTPRIAGTRTKLIQLVLDKLAYGWSPEELHFQHPHLTLGQIYSALAYYSDHQEELDRDIEDRLRQVDRIQAVAEPSPLVARLKALALEPLRLMTLNDAHRVALKRWPPWD